MIRLATWNLNGVRAAARTHLIPWMSQQNLDVVGFQEVRASPAQLPPTVRDLSGYHAYYHPAQKGGYSGVAILSRRLPERVYYGFTEDPHAKASAFDAEVDAEGRVLAAEYPGFVFISSYFPNSREDHSRLDFKIRFCERMARYCEGFRKRGLMVLLSGDLNIAHQEIDLYSPETHEQSAGFLPEERAWLTQFLQQGYIDTYRHYQPQAQEYTWWSYRRNMRSRGLGWRIDYFVVSAESIGRIRQIRHQSETLGSDHCPVEITLS